MTGGEECGGYVQGKHAPWGLFNLFTTTVQSPNLSIGRLIHELKHKTVFPIELHSVFPSVERFGHMYVLLVLACAYVVM